MTENDSVPPSDALRDPFTIYYTGGLFDCKELVGNAMLARYVEIVSNERYKCNLAQNCEQTTDRAVEVRNQDLRMVASSDLGLFNFDGTDLDSGTVIEFMTAKMFDIPSLLLRTDFRHSGDAAKNGDPWNLMASAYPRTSVIWIPGMALYQQHFKLSPGLRDPLEAQKLLYTELAGKIVAKLDELVRMIPIHRFESKEDAVGFIRRTLAFAGDSFLESLPSDFAEQLVDRKIHQKLIVIRDSD